MRPQVVHESEVHRQHVRLEVPIRVEIDGARYRVDDWSVGGFGVENVVAPHRPGERFRVRVVFPFEGFELGVRVDAQMVYVDADRQRFGCQFLALSAQHLGLFHYIADAYLSGGMVAADDVLRTYGRGAAAVDGPAAAAVAAAPFGGATQARGGEGRRDPVPVDGGREDRPAGDGGRLQGAGRRYAAYAAAVAAALLLMGLAAVGVYDRFLTVAAASAVVDAPVYRLRAPIAGLFTSATGPGEIVERGQAIGLVRGPDGTVAPLESPCACIVLEQRGLQGQFYQPGESLIALIGAEQPPRVRAQVPLDGAERLEVGGRASIRLPGGDEELEGEIERIDVQPERAGLRPTETVTPVTGNLVQVWIRPGRPLELDDLGTLVSVRFPTLPDVGLP